MTKKYYLNRNKKYYTKYSKKEIKNMVNIYDLNTFIPLLKDMDYPYIKAIWDKIVEEYNNDTVFGRYIATMRLAAYRNFNFLDSDYLNTEKRRK